MRANILRMMLLACIGATLAGCASDPRHRDGLSWVQSNEAEKARLQAAGFPQYGFD